MVKNVAALTDRANDEQYISRSLEITFPGKRIEFPAKPKTTLIHSLRIDSSSEIQDYAHSLNGCKLKIAREIEALKEIRATGNLFQILFSQSRRAQSMTTRIQRSHALWSCGDASFSLCKLPSHPPEQITSDFPKS